MVSILACQAISKSYGVGTLAEVVLDNVTFSMCAGQACALIGPSGSGKTTLLSILGCLLRPTCGELKVEDRVVDHGSRRALEAIRRTKIGFVFQHAQLLPFLSMRENLRIVGRNADLVAEDLRMRIAELGGRLGVERLLDKLPEHASGGQRQRVAIARAIVHRPPIVLADEPTAALDWHNGEAVIRLLTEQAKLDNALLLTVTHDTRLLGFFDRVFQIEDGKVVER